MSLRSKPRLVPMKHNSPGRKLRFPFVTEPIPVSGFPPFSVVRFFAPRWCVLPYLLTVRLVSTLPLLRAPTGMVPLINGYVCASLWSDDRFPPDPAAMVRHLKAYLSHPWEVTPMTFIVKPNSRGVVCSSAALCSNLFKPDQAIHPASQVPHRVVKDDKGCPPGRVDLMADFSSTFF